LLEGQLGLQSTCQNWAEHLRVQTYQRFLRSMMSCGSWCISRKANQGAIFILFHTSQPPRLLTISYQLSAMFTPLNCSKRTPAGFHQGAAS